MRGSWNGVEGALSDSDGKRVQRPRQIWALGKTIRILAFARADEGLAVLGYF